MRLRLLVIAAAFVFTTAVPQTAMAHGELLIRIAATTKKIEAATNNTAQLYLERGELHREHRDWAAAEADYARATQLDPKFAAVDFCRAKMLDDAGQLQAARAMFSKVISNSPANGEAFVGRARVLVKLEDRKSAVADFRRGLELLASPQVEYFHELAQTLVAESKTDEALRSLDEGMKKFGPVAFLQTYALELELAQKNTDAALARLDTIIEKAERKETWLARRGDILLAAGRTDEARKSFEAALAAVSTLPLRLQQLPHMVKLKARVNASLVGKSEAKPFPLISEHIPQK